MAQAKTIGDNLITILDKMIHENSHVYISTGERLRHQLLDTALSLGRT